MTHPNVAQVRFTVPLGLTRHTSTFQHNYLFFFNVILRPERKQSWLIGVVQIQNGRTVLNLKSSQFRHKLYLFAGVHIWLLVTSTWKKKTQPLLLYCTLITGTFLFTFLWIKTLFCLKLYLHSVCNFLAVLIMWTSTSSGFFSLGSQKDAPVWNNPFYYLMKPIPSAINCCFL